MAGRRREKVTEDQVGGFKYFKKLLPILDRLHDEACARDRAQNRQLHFDQYSALILLYMFNPIITSLRGHRAGQRIEEGAIEAGMCPHVIGFAFGSITGLRQ